MYTHYPERRAFSWVDIVVLAGIAAIIYGIVGLAQRWGGAYHAAVAIDLSPSALPRYALFSFSRAVASYSLSLAFTLVYSYAAAKIRNADRVMIPILDIFQAVPVLGFMPGLVLGLVSLFPKSNIGIELTCIIMIFTGQAWNMAFSFYGSLKTVPHELQEASRIIGLNWRQRLRHIELPFAAIGLAWNSLMSIAGGWFFLTICESFSLGDRKFRVPGIGSYMATAIDHNDHKAMLYGLLTMFLLIVFVDFLIWRPVMAWVRKFQMEESQEEAPELPFVTAWVRESYLISGFWPLVWRRMKLFTRRRSRWASAQHVPISGAALLPRVQFRLVQVGATVQRFGGGLTWLFRKTSPVLAVVFCIWGGIRLWELVRPLSGNDWKVIWGSTGLSFVRVLIAVVVSSLWTIPVGFWIGMSPKLTRFFQPLVQIAASFPMPMLFPLVAELMIRWHIGIHWGSVVLLVLGVQWYILFNVLAGAMVIARDMRDGMTMIGAKTWTRWWKLYLPSAFPALVTGWLTAAGGAWNASIVAEFVEYGGKRLVAPGIGSLITRATLDANFPLLAGCLLAMVITVVGLNQTWWRWLSETAEERFTLDK